MNEKAEEYVKPKDVTAPKEHWELDRVILDRGEGDCAYAIGKWNGLPRIGFRWNGTTKENRLGTPLVFSNPIWLILDPHLYEAVIKMLPFDEQKRVREFLE